MKIQDTTKKIVVPWDFSDLSLGALIRAYEMAADPSMIRIVHVTQSPSAYEYGVVWQSVSEDTIRQGINDAFRKKVQSDSRLTDVSFTILFGDPGKRICDFAAERDAEMIIMPSHGRHGIARMLMGSVAERVVRFAPCPVLILPASFDESDAESSSSSSSALA